MNGFAAIVATFLRSCCLRALPVLPVVLTVRASLVKAALKQARCSVMVVLTLIMSYPVYNWKAKVSSAQVTVGCSLSLELLSGHPSGYVALDLSEDC